MDLTPVKVLLELRHRLTCKVMHRLALIASSVKLSEISVNVLKHISPLSVLPCRKNDVVECRQGVFFDRLDVLLMGHLEDIVLVMVLVYPWEIFIAN